MAGLLPPILVELKANASEFHAEMGKARAEVTKLQTSGSASLEKFAAVGKAALLGLAGVAVTVGTEAVHMADKFELSHSRLVVAIKNTGSTFDAYSGQISAADKKLEGLGFTNAQTEQALGTLVAGTGSTSQALKEMGLAADLARFKNLDLNDAAFMLTRALQGNSRVLKQLGIDLPTAVASASQLKKMQEAVRVETERYNLALEKYHAKSKTTQADLDALKIAHDHLVFSTKQLTDAQHSAITIQDAISAKIGGTAVAASETFSGKLATLRARTEDLGKNIGLWLIPKIEALVSVTAKIVDWLGRHKTAAEALTFTIGTLLVGAITAYIAKMVVSFTTTAAHIATQIGEWVALKVSAVTNLGQIVSSSESASARVMAVWDEAFGEIAAAGATAAAAVDAELASTVGPAAAAGTEAGTSFRIGFLGSLGAVGTLLMGAMSFGDQDPRGANYFKNNGGATGSTPPGYHKGTRNGIPVFIKDTPGPIGTTSATTLSSISPISGSTGPHLGAGFAGSIYDAYQISKIPPVPTTFGGGGGGAGGGGGGSGGAKGPKPLTAAQIAALKFSTKMTNLESAISGESGLNPGSVAMAKNYEKAEQATLREAEANKKHAAALLKAAVGAKAKHDATLVLTRAQRDVNAATKNLLATKAEEKNLLLAQAQAAADLANAKIEAGLNFADAIAVAKARVQEAQNTLGADQPDSLKYYQDLAALHQAQVDLMNALTQNTTATATNTAVTAAASGGPLNQLPTYLANRAAVNAGAYAGINVTVSNPSGQQLLTAINAELRRNGKPPLT